MFPVEIYHDCPAVEGRDRLFIVSYIGYLNYAQKIMSGYIEYITDLWYGVQKVR